MPPSVPRFLALALPLSLVACGGSPKNGAEPPGAGGSQTDGAAEPPGTPAASDAGIDAAPLTGPVCTVASTGSSGTLLSGTLLLPAGPTVGELLIDATGKIACAAASCATASGYASATHLACANAVISPSLINAHDHTEYATRAPDTLPTTRYEHRNDWRTGAEGAKALPHTNSTTDAATIAAQELRFVMGGATSVVGSGGVGGLLRNMADYSKPAFLEGLTGKTVYFDTFPMGDSNGTLVTSGCAYPSIRGVSAAMADGVYAPHVAEGINAAAENEMTCASQSSNTLITANTSVIHGVGTNAKDVGVLAAAKARLVWSPRSNISLYGDTAPVTVYKAEGVTIALGTDWLPSGSMNELRELACADSLNQKYFGGAFSDQELWEMATKNAAIASGFDTQIGTLEAGKLADVAVFDGRTNREYRAVIAADVEDVRLVLRGGKALYGDADLVGALAATGCTALDVCGASRSVCVDTPSVTLAQIQSAATPVYPLFFCRGTAPTNEPTCVPYRDSYPNGISATDRDGDGVPDASDDCPSVFDPPRPMDGTKQADVDGDGAGDACDAKPLDASSH